jgi:uncharacterized protein (TIGR03437 family)
MDAAFNSLKTSALFLAAVVLALAPLHAQTQTFTYPLSSTVVSLGSGGTSITPTGSQDNATPPNPITYTVLVSYPDGARPWLSVGYDQSSCTGGPYTYTTGQQLGIGPGCFAGTLRAPDTAIVTLSTTNPFVYVTFTVSYTPGSISSGGTITASPNPLAVTLNTGATTTSTIQLSTTSTATITFTLVSTQPASWISVSSNNNVVAANAPATLTAQISTTGITTNQSTNIVVQYGGTTLQIPVNLTIGSTANPLQFSTGNTVSWAYTTGGTAPSASVTFTNGSASAGYTFSITNTSSINWLLVNNQTFSGSSTIANGMSLSTVSVASLPTGNYTETVSVVDASDNLAGTLTVSLTVGSPNGITISPSPITIAVPTGAACCLYPTFTVTSSVGGSLSLALSGLPAGVTVYSPSLPTTITANQPLTITLQVQPGGLFSLSYSGTVTATVNTLSQAANVTINVGGSSASLPATVAPTALQFTYQAGSGVTLAPQAITIVGSGTYTVSTPVQNENNTNRAWLLPLSTEFGNLSQSGTVLNVYVNPASLAVGTYTGSFTVTTIDSSANVNPQQVNVTLYVTSTVALNPTPGAINISYAAGGTVPSGYSIQVAASDGTAIPITAVSSANWVTASAATGATTPASVNLQFSPGSLVNGIDSGTITITGGGAQLIVPVVLLVTGGTTSTLVPTPSSLNFAAIANGTPPQSQVVTVTANTQTAFTAATFVTTPAGGTWLGISPSGSLTTNQNIQVAINQGSLIPGTYTGGIALTANGGQITVPVTLVVSTNSTSAGVTVNPTSLSFTWQPGSAAGLSQSVSVTSASGAAGVPFAITSAASWLSASVSGGSQATTPATVTVTVDPTGLTAGSYNTNVTIAPTGGTPVNVPVSFTVQAGPSIAVSQSSMAFTYAAGGVAPAAQNVQVTVTGNAAFTAAASSTGNWLTVTPTSYTATSSTSTTNVSVGVTNISSLTPGTYNGTITVAGTGGTQGLFTVNVTLTVTAPLPTITSVVNAASFLAGPISPGEIITLFGTALGPTTSLSLTLDSSGQNVLTQLGGVTVSFNGYQAPLTYVSATQINAIVPYAVAGIASPWVQVKYQNEPSNTYSLQPAASAPGIFTMSSGTGQAAALNQDNSYNSVTPAARGSVIQLFMTGEGQTAPNGITGRVTSGVITPLLPVAVFIGNQPAALQFAGEAPGDVAGVMQVNAVVPTNITPGASVSLVVSVGTNNFSQPGVTIAVK